MEAPREKTEGDSCESPCKINSINAMFWYMVEFLVWF